jgi:hypothetical protein
MCPLVKKNIDTALEYHKGIHLLVLLILSKTNIKAYYVNYV